MLKATKLPRKGIFGNTTYEVMDEGAVVGTINETKSTMELGGRPFTMERKGIIGPEFLLKSSDAIVATAKQKPLFNSFTLTHGGKEWIYKAAGLTGSKFALFEGENETGTVGSPSMFNFGKETIAELPAELPLEVRAFLILLALHMWAQKAAD
jgi:hypothetical protein